MEDPITLLYVDDDADWTFTVKSILEKRGFYVDVASDGDEAEDLFALKHYDLVLLDVYMPGKNGWDLIKEFKEINEWIPVIMYTSVFDVEKFAEAFGLGAEDYIAKGSDWESFSQRLKAILFRFEKQKENSEKLQITPEISFTPDTGMLQVMGVRYILKANEIITLKLLCLNMDKEVARKEFCEEIWGKGFYDDKKVDALKNIIVSLRKYFYTTNVTIKNKRWGGYYMTKI